MAARGRMRYWHWFRSTGIDDSDVRHYLAVNPTIIQENGLMGKLEDTNILLEVHAFLKKFVSILKQAVKTKEVTKNSNIEEEKR